MTRLIDAEKLKDDIEKNEKDIMGIEDVIDFIDNSPTVPQPDFKEGYKQAILDGKTNFSRPQGKWIECDGFCECSECQHREDNDRFIWNDMNFCSTCGAEMVEVTKNE